MTPKLVTMLALVASMTTAVPLHEARADHGGLHDLIDRGAVACLTPGGCPRPGGGGGGGGGDRSGGRSGHSDLAAGAFGFVAGAIIGSAMSAGSVHSSDYHAWLAYCSARYRSFNPRTGMYLGYDGRYHPCR